MILITFVLRLYCYLYKYSNKKVKKSIVGVGEMVDLPEKYMLKIEDQEPE